MFADFFSSLQDPGGQAGLGGEIKGSVQETDRSGRSFHPIRQNCQGHGGLPKEQRRNLACDLEQIYILCMPGLKTVAGKKFCCMNCRRACNHDQ